MISLLKKNNLLLNILIIATVIIFFQNLYSGILLRYLNNPQFFNVFFSDFYLVYAGSEILYQGNNPYKEWIKLHDMPFFNPPIVFSFFKFMANFEYSVVVKFWFFFLSVCFLSIPLIFFKFLKINLKFFFIFLISFGGLALSVFLTGNLSIFLNFLFVIGLLFLNRNQDQYFYVILSFLSLIKFPYLIFFGLPFLIRKLEKKIFINTLFYLSAIFLIYIISYYSDKEIFISWLSSLEFSKNIGDGGDFGRGLFRILDNYFFQSNAANYIVYLAISGVFFIFFIFLFKKSKILNDKKNQSLALCLAVMALTICLPRLKSYDVLIIIPSIFFIIKSVNFRINKNLNDLFKFFLFLMLFCWTSPYAPILLSSILIFLFSIDLKYNFIVKK